MTSPAVVDLLRSEWQSLTELCRSLSEPDWDVSTECPGWSVRDNVAHVIGTERSLLGDPAPDTPDATPDWVKNPIGQLNEAWVAARRGLSGSEITAELEETTRRRLEQLDAMTDADWAAEVPGPTGMAPYREFMSIRVMDCWVHEQDIRRALDRPGHTTGPVAEHSVARFVPAMGFVVGKKAAASDGQSVLFDLRGDLARRIAVIVADGRAQVGDQAPADPTVTLGMTAETWWCLSLGRWDGADAIDDGRVEITGDLDLGRAVVTNLGFMI